MSSQLQSIIDGKIDFEGQKLVEQGAHYALVVAAVLSFGLGYFTQSLQMCLGTFALSVLAVMLTFVPPWPFLNRHPPKWRKVGGKEL
ncbi:microsomal signal peptidase subunit [Ceratobasidium sp. AG-I]|nr:microsomal signal peptidase subunit [Ceratobasidium sp. AG-I]